MLALLYMRWDAENKWNNNKLNWLGWKQWQELILEYFNFSRKGYCFSRCAHRLHPSFLSCCGFHKYRKMSPSSVPIATRYGAPPGANASAVIDFLRSRIPLSEYSLFSPWPQTTTVPSREPVIKYRESADQLHDQIIRVWIPVRLSVLNIRENWGAVNKMIQQLSFKKLELLSISSIHGY